MVMDKSIYDVRGIASQFEDDHHDHQRQLFLGRPDKLCRSDHLFGGLLHGYGFQCLRGNLES